MPCGVTMLDMEYSRMLDNERADRADKAAKRTCPDCGRAKRTADLEYSRMVDNECADRADEEAERAAMVTKKVADAATRAACDLRTILRRGGSEKDLTAETRKWIKEHDKWDKIRTAKEEAEGLREKTRQAGLKKLTLDERRALGL